MGTKIIFKFTHINTMIFFLFTTFQQEDLFWSLHAYPFLKRKLHPVVNLERLFFDFPIVF